MHTFHSLGVKCVGTKARSDSLLAVLFFFYHKIPDYVLVFRGLSPAMTYCTCFNTKSKVKQDYFNAI